MRELSDTSKRLVGHAILDQTQRMREAVALKHCALPPLVGNLEDSGKDGVAHSGGEGVGGKIGDAMSSGQSCAVELSNGLLEGPALANFKVTSEAYGKVDGKGILVHKLHLVGVDEHRGLASHGKPSIDYYINGREDLFQALSGVLEGRDLDRQPYDGLAEGVDAPVHDSVVGTCTSSKEGSAHATNAGTENKNVGTADATQLD